MSQGRLDGSRIIETYWSSQVIEFTVLGNVKSLLKPDFTHFASDVHSFCVDIMLSPNTNDNNAKYTTVSFFQWW